MYINFKDLGASKIFKATVSLKSSLGTMILECWSILNEKQTFSVLLEAYVKWAVFMTFFKIYVIFYQFKEKLKFQDFLLHRKNAKELLLTLTNT